MAMLMNNIKVKREALLKTLQNNLKMHRAAVVEASAARRQEILEYFTDTAAHIERDPNYQPKESITFPKPKDNSSDYERAIRMVEMTTDEVIELTEDQFDKLVMDNWGWKQELLRTSSMYAKL